MNESLIQLLAVLAAVTGIAFFSSLIYFKFPVLPKIISELSLRFGEQKKSESFNCRIRQIKKNEENSVRDIFNIEISGLIETSVDSQYAIVKVWINDTTSIIQKALPVYSNSQKCRINNSKKFCFTSDIGKLTDRNKNISDWMCVAQIPADWVILPHKGKRKLHFKTSVLSKNNKDEIASTKAELRYDNPSWGYIDLEENSKKAKILTVPIALTVSASDKVMRDCEIAVIKEWVKNNIELFVPEKTKRKTEKTLNTTISFFRDGNLIDIRKLCKEIADTAPVAVRYDILELCLYVVQADGVACVEEIAILKNLVQWLDVDMKKFSGMAEKIIPINVHEVEDLEIMLGMNENMTKTETHQQLLDGYRKWNARVISSDPEIQNQANHMLELIAETRNN